MRMRATFAFWELMLWTLGVYALGIFVGLARGWWF